MTPNTPILQDTIVLSDKDFNYEKNKLRRKTKSKDGFFHLGDKMYPKLTGTREEENWGCKEGKGEQRLREEK